MKYYTADNTNKHQNVKVNYNTHVLVTAVGASLEKKLTEICHLS